MKSASAEMECKGVDGRKCIHTQDNVGSGEVEKKDTPEADPAVMMRRTDTGTSFSPVLTMVILILPDSSDTEYSVGSNIS